MKLKIHEIVAGALFAAGLIELFIIPKIILKSRAGMEKKEMDKVFLVMRISSYVTIGIGILFLLGIIPLSGE